MKNENQVIFKIIRCLHYTIHKGWLNASSTLITKHFNPKQRDLYEEFVKIRKKLKLENLPIFANLTHLLPEQSPSLVKFLKLSFCQKRLEPCYMWAQNMTHVLMKIKFSPKLDVPDSLKEEYIQQKCQNYLFFLLYSSEIIIMNYNFYISWYQSNFELILIGYLEVHRLNVSITLPELTISAVAFTGDVSVLFYLNIKTYKFMNAHGSKWYQTEMGTITLEILKSPSPYVWRNIHAEIHYNPHNQYIWWEIYRQYQEQFEAGFQLLEDTEIKREEREDKYHLKEDRMIADKKLIREKVAEQKSKLNQIFRDKMYCTQMRTQNANYIPDPFDWEAWQI